MQRYLGSLFAINGSFRKVLTKGRVQEMGESAHLGRSCLQISVEPSPAFDEGGKRGLCRRVLGGSCCYYLEVGSPCLSPSFANLMTYMLQQMSGFSERSQCMLAASDRQRCGSRRAWKSCL